MGAPYIYDISHLRVNAGYIFSKNILYKTLPETYLLLTTSGQKSYTLAMGQIYEKNLAILVFSH